MSFLKNTLAGFLKDTNIKYLFSKGLISLGFRVLGVCFSFYTIKLISNFYFAKVYGTFSLAQTIIQLLCVILTLGVQNTIIVEVNRNIEQKDFSAQNFLFHVIKLVLFVSIIPVFLIYFFAPQIAIFIFHKTQLTSVFQLIAISLPFFLLHEIAVYYFIATKKLILFGWFMFIVPNVLFFTFIFLFRNDSINAYNIVTFYGISFLITLIIEFCFIFFKQINFSKPQFSYKKTLIASLPMMFSGVMSFLINWTDVLMLGSFSTEENVGIYNAAFKVGMIVYIIIISMSIVIGPKVTEAYESKNFSELKKIIQKATQLITFVTLPIVLLIIIFSEYLLSYFGNAFIAGKTVLIIIAISTFISAVCGNVDLILNLTNNKKLVFYINIFVFLINLILNYFLIPSYGINGSAIASLIATIVLNFTCVYFIKKKFGYYTLI